MLHQLNLLIKMLFKTKLVNNTKTEHSLLLCLCAPIFYKKKKQHLLFIEKKKKIIDNSLMLLSLFILARVFSPLSLFFLLEKLGDFCRHKPFT